MTKTEDTKVSVLVSLFNWIQKTKPAAKKRSKFRKFLDTYCDSTDYFSAVRLILPSLDRERGSYGLKEHVLGTYLVEALGMSKDSEDAIRLKNWRKNGAANNAGNFPLVAAEVLQRRQGMISGGLTIKELNDLLDRLASSDTRAEKISVLSALIKKTNAQEMKWIVMIILKDLKLGISEKSIFHEFHPDAEDLFNVTCDLKLVCEKLRDRSQRHKRQDIEVGKAVRPQLAMRVGDAHAAWKKLHGKEVVVECKFDGDRIQIHKNGSEVHYFSRNYLDHSEYGPAMSSIIVNNILADRCILDGEMLVWDTSLNRFAEFGSNQEIAKAAREGLSSDRQLCYVAFDVLYVGDTSVIHQSLKERHELLRKFVRPLKGRLEILVPNGGLNTRNTPGEPCWSLIAHNVDDMEKFFEDTIENRDEGIVLKDLGSKWEPSDRSGKWLKLKPEYVRSGSDLDVLIIGGYYGSGRRGGEVAQFLVALAERPAPNAYPRRFVSFCRVGTGLSDEELDAVVTKLKPYFRKYEYPKKPSPTFYQVTNNSKERPDVWIESPEKSLILSITSDIRTIRSEVFAAPYSLRFPRIDKVRYDKPWHECLDVQSFVELVHSSNGTTQKGNEYGSQQHAKPKSSKLSRKGEKKNISLVPSHFIQTDVSSIKGETLIFSKMVFYFVNSPPSHPIDTMHKIVVENGGTFSMNLNHSVTHCIAAENKGIKYQAAKRHGDVIHYSWVLDCCSQRKLLQLQPKYFLYLSDSSKSKLQQEIDEYSDSYFLDLDIADIKQLLSNIDRSEDSKTINYYKKKFCPRDKWCTFHDCCIYFYTLTQSLCEEEVLLELSMRRLKLEVQFGGGKVCCDLENATHMVIFSDPPCVNFEALMESFCSKEKRLLLNNKLHVVGSQWLEDCLEGEQKIDENCYSLKPSGIEKLQFDSWEQALDVEEGSNISDDVQSFPDNKVSAENPKPLASPKKGGLRKRGRPAGGANTKKQKTSINPLRRTRARVGKNALKLYENESDEGIDDENGTEEEDIKMDEGTNEDHVLIHNSSSGVQQKPSDNPRRRTRARVGKNALKLYENESDEGLDDEKGTEEEVIKMGEGTNEDNILIHNRSSGVEQNVAKETSESLDRGKAASEQAGDDSKVEQSAKTAEVGISERYSAGTSDRAEAILDPVQAMLLDMIPSLGMKKPETISPTIEETQQIDSAAVAGPPKKKKVSYKDLASELLKD